MGNATIVANDTTGAMTRVGINSINKNVVFAEHKIIDEGGI